MKYAEFIIRPPLVLITVNAVNVSADDYKKDFLAMQTRILNDLEESVWIVNGRDIRLLPSEHRILAGNWIKEHNAMIKQRVRAVFLVDCSFWVELLLKSIHLVAKSPIPFHILKTTDDAYKMIRDTYRINVTPIKDGL